METQYGYRDQGACTLNWLNLCATRHSENRLPRALRLALFICLAALPSCAMADDPCAEPTKEVNALLTALSRTAPGIVNGGTFVVRSLDTPGATSSFQVSYLVSGKSVFARRVEQRDTVSEHLVVAVSRRSAGMLELGYGFGAGGRVGCNYLIGRSRDAFVARRVY